MEARASTTAWVVPSTFKAPRRNRASSNEPRAPSIDSNLPQPKATVVIITLAPENVHLSQGSLTAISNLKSYINYLVLHPSSFIFRCPFSSL